MTEILNSVEEAKPQNKATSLRRYWYFFLPFTLILFLMLWFPLRIHIGDLHYTVILYGSITLACLITAVWISYRFGKRSRRLIAMIMLCSMCSMCSMCSGWQVFDLVVLRYESSLASGFGYDADLGFSDYDGFAWYNMRYPSDKILCNRIFERYFGNRDIAITVRINRNATWFHMGCGG